MDVIIDEKKKLRKLSTYWEYSDGKSKPKSLKFVSFLLFIRQVILNDLGDWNNI